jgi:radical SAM superfamily enzyme YgiQ (UPF0313 family)
MPEYEPPVFRPPSEAGSLILQVTIGCSHNGCAFCSMYRNKRFRTKEPALIQSEILEARSLIGPDVRRVFLADGDAMCLSTPRLTDILGHVNEAFPRLQRVGIYANARDVLAKSAEELAELRRLSLKILYMGLESGDEATLEAIGKGATPAEIVRAVQCARAAGMSVSVMVLIGLAGRERSLLHARASAAAINEMAPNYTALLTYTPVPGSPLHDQMTRGNFHLPSPLESIDEIRAFVGAVECDTYFTCNHASNYLPLTGRLPRRRREILASLDAALAGAVPLKPERQRGL